MIDRILYLKPQFLNSCYALLQRISYQDKTVGRQSEAIVHVNPVTYLKGIKKYCSL